jgi:hypothetical protein
MFNFFKKGSTVGEDVEFGQEEVDAIQAVDAEHQENVEYYLAGQPEDEAELLKGHLRNKLGLPSDWDKACDDAIIELTEGMRVKDKLVILADYDNSWNIVHCTAIGCGKMVNGCCMAYADPTQLLWHRQGKECATGPYQSTVATRAKAINPLKASKRASK